VSKMSETNPVVTITIEKSVYLKFSAYAKYRGFSVKRATELALKYAAAHDQASAWLQEHMDIPSVPSPKSHDISKDLVRTEIKEMTQTAVVVPDVQESYPEVPESSGFQDILDGL